MAPVMPFLAERLYSAVKDTKNDARESVHLESWPKVGEIHKEIIASMRDVREVVSLALMVRTKEGISVRQPLQTLKTNILIDKTYYDLIEDEVNVKEIRSDTTFTEKIHLDTTLTDRLVREGDVRNLMRAVQDMRKEMNLSPKDTVSLLLQSAQDIGTLDTLQKTCNVVVVFLVKEVQPHTAMLSFGIVSFSLTKVS